MEQQQQWQRRIGRGRRKTVGETDCSGRIRRSNNILRSARTHCATDEVNAQSVHRTWNSLRK